MVRKVSGDMIKMRLQGLESDLMKMIEDMKSKYEVLEVSEPYPNRGESKLVRIYVTLKALD